LSTDEQDAAIGRLARERADATRQCALIAEELTNKFFTRTSNLYGSLSGLCNSSGTVKVAWQKSLRILGLGLDIG
jgi:hypothetical protein